MYTEDEAKTKWCPEAREAIGDDRYGGATTNRGIPDDCNCFASACMAWRWYDGMGPVEVAGTNMMPYGYCGKGGKV
jgi:hypothetical protein